MRLSWSFFCLLFPLSECFSPAFVVPRTLQPSAFAATRLQSTVEDTTTASSSSSRLSKARQLLEQVLVDAPEEEVLEPDEVVPENYWSNGHLQEGDIVTRWARGQKVAEPLVKYDPVAAEKLLFRQPRKVRASKRGVPLALSVRRSFVQP